MKKHPRPVNFLERRAVSIPLNAVIFITNFFLVYFIWLLSAPEVSGIGRVVTCWIVAYGLTWMMTYLTKGAVRVALAVFLLGVLTFIMTFQHGT